MKQINSILVFLLLLSVFSCNKDTTKSSSEKEYSETDLTNLEKIQSSNYYTFSTKEEVLSDSTVLDSTSVETMYDVENRLNTYLETGNIDDGYEEIASNYKDILVQDDDGEYRSIIYSPILSSKINSNGVLAINDSVYVFANNMTYKYLFENEQITLIDSSSYSTSILKSINFSEGNDPFYIYEDWEPSYRQITRSSRRVKVYGYVQAVDDFGFIIGSKTKYYNKYLGSYHLWKESSDFSVTISVYAYADEDDTSMTHYYLTGSNGKYLATKSISFSKSGIMSKGIYLNGFVVEFDDTHKIDLYYTLVSSN